MRRSAVLLILLVIITSASAVLRPKFKHFYQKYGYEFIQAAGQCQPELDAYYAGTSTISCSTPCACAADCLLAGLTPTQQANTAASNVLLGLIPAILAFVGPSIAELAVISTWCPFLGAILTLASPAFNIQRVFARPDVLDVHDQPFSKTSTFYHRWARKQSSIIHIAIRLMEYTVAIASLINTIENSIRLDLRTVPSFRCSALLLPLAWSLLGVLSYIFAAIAVRLRRYENDGSNMSLRKRINLRAAPWRQLHASYNTPLSELFFWTGSASAVVLMIFGIADLSSLLFISANDAIFVLVRYVASATACKIILLGELALLRFETSRPLERAGS